MKRASLNYNFPDNISEEKHFKTQKVALSLTT